MRKNRINSTVAGYFSGKYVRFFTIEGKNCIIWACIILFEKILGELMLRVNFQKQRLEQVNHCFIGD